MSFELFQYQKWFFIIDSLCLESFFDLNKKGKAYKDFFSSLKTEEKAELDSKIKKQGNIL
jgi:hypothetical protein